MITDLLKKIQTKQNLSKPTKKVTEYSEFSFLTDYRTGTIESKEILIHPRLQIASRVTTKGKIKFCNSDYIMVTGRNEKEILRNKVSITIHPQMPKTIFNYVISELKKGEEVIAVINHLDKYGNSYWLSTEFIPNNSNNFSLAFSTKSKPTSKNAIEKVRKIYNALYRIENRNSEFLVEDQSNKKIADKYFDGLIEMEYGNYEGFIIDTFQ